MTTRARPTTQPTVGNFDKFTFPLIRRVFPTLVDVAVQESPKTPLQQFAEEVFAEECPPKPPEWPVLRVEPMTAPVGGIAFYRPRYGAKQK